MAGGYCTKGQHMAESRVYVMTNEAGIVTGTCCKGDVYIAVRQAAARKAVKHSWGSAWERAMRRLEAAHADDDEIIGLEDLLDGGDA